MVVEGERGTVADSRMTTANDVSLAHCNLSSCTTIRPTTSSSPPPFSTPRNPSHTTTNGRSLRAGMVSLLFTSGSRKPFARSNLRSEVVRWRVSGWVVGLGRVTERH